MWWRHIFRCLHQPNILLPPPPPSSPEHHKSGYQQSSKTVSTRVHPDNDYLHHLVLVSVNIVALLRTWCNTIQVQTDILYSNRPAPVPPPGVFTCEVTVTSRSSWRTRASYLELHWWLVTSCVTWRLCTNTHSQHRHSYQHVDTQLHSYQHAAKLGSSIYHWTLCSSYFYPVQHADIADTTCNLHLHLPTNKL